MNQGEEGTEIANKSCMSTQSSWMHGLSLQNYEPLRAKQLKVDVAIVGGGISGVTAAYLLQKAGWSVALLERDRIGSGETGRTTAHLTQILDQRYYQLEKKFGKKGARRSAESSLFAIEFIEKCVQELHIKCDYSRVPGYLYTEKKDNLRDLEREFKAMQKLGLGVTSRSSAPLPFETVGAIEVPNQAQFHPLLYLQKLAATFVEEGGRIFEKTQAVQMIDGHPCKVITPHGVLVANQIICAADSPLSSPVLLQTKVYPYRSYVLGATPREFLSLAGLFYDTADPYHYIRTQNDLLIIGGSDHRTGEEKDTDQHFRTLIRYAEARFDLVSVPYRWSGQVMEPADGLPYIGKNPFSKNIYVATGYSGTGMTFGTLSGVILSDLVQEKLNPWADLYDPNRIKPFASAKRLFTENLDYPKCMIKDWGSPSEVKSFEEIPPGEGKLLRTGVSKAAVYRDDTGALHALSAVCPHMGCMVKFNPSETSWDCPCHGSRFSTEGELLHGPALKGLKKLTSEEMRSLESHETKPARKEKPDKAA